MTINKFKGQYGEPYSEYIHPPFILTDKKLNKKILNFVMDFMKFHNIPMGYGYTHKFYVLIETWEKQNGKKK